MLTVRGAHGRGFGLGDIGKAIKAVSKDPPKMPDASKKIEQKIEQAAQDPEKLVWDASQALAGADASTALDTAKDAAQSASGALPVASVSVGGGRAGAGPEQSTTASPVAPLGEEAAGSEAVQDAVSEMLKDQDVEDTVDRIAPGGVAEAVAKVRGSSSAVSQAVSQAKQAMDGRKVEVGSLAEKAKTATVKEVMDLVGTDDAKKFDGSAWRNLKNAVRRDDVKNAIANPAQTALDMGKNKFRSPTDGNVDEQDELGVDGNVGLVMLTVLAGLILGAYVFFQRVAKPRPVGTAMLSGDHETDSSVAAGHWMGASARDLIPNSPGGNETLNSRNAISNFEWLSRS